MNIIEKIKRFFTRESVKKPEIVVTEGIEGRWYYHLSDADYYRKALCGKPAMPTSLSIELWGTITHLKERYCEECFRIHQEILKKG